MTTTVRTRPFDLLSPLLDVLWADGRMSFAQVRAVDQVATLMGVDDVAARIASVRLAEFDDALPPTPVRAVAYALAVWVAAADGRIHPDERRVLNHFERYWDLCPNVARRTRRLALGMARVGAGRPTPTQLEALIRAAQQLATDDVWREPHGRVEDLDGLGTRHHQDPIVDGVSGVHHDLVPLAEPTPHLGMVGVLEA